MNAGTLSAIWEPTDVIGCGVAAVFLPGRPPTTNEALDLLRAAGVYNGRRHAMPGVRPNPRADKYAQAAAEWRNLAHLARNRLGVGFREALATARTVDLVFEFACYPRADRASNYLAAKWIEDGLLGDRADRLTREVRFVPPRSGSAGVVVEVQVFQKEM